MSINLGFYDFFSYLLPGFVYLYAVNDLLRVLGLKYVNLTNVMQAGQEPAFGLVALGLFAAYIVGHIFDPLSLNFFFKLVFRIRNPQGATTISLNTIKERYPKLGIKFVPKDWEALLIILRQRSYETAQSIDRFQADSIMLRNIAFGLLLMAVTNVIAFFTTMTVSFLLIALVELFACWMLASEGFKFRLWFFTQIYEASLIYGTSIEEVISYEKNRDGKTKGQKQTNTKIKL